MEKLKPEDLLKVGLHFGHRTSKWHPKMEPYIFTVRNGIHIIDIEETLKGLLAAGDFLEKVAREKKIILFVGTKPTIKDLVKKTAQEVECPYVVERWLGGTLTNFSTINKSIKKYIELKKDKEKGGWERYVKKERVTLEKELERLEKKFGGIEKLERLPDVVVILDVKEQDTAVKEARDKNIPLIGLCDTNVNPEGIDYVIPGNDDSIKGVSFVLDFFKKAILAGKKINK